MSNSENSNMSDSEHCPTSALSISTDIVANLRAVFEPAMQESQRVTGNAPNTALGDVCQGPASETLENSAKDDEEREQQSVKWTTGEKGSLEGKLSIQDKNMIKGLEMEQGQSKEDHTPSSRLGNSLIGCWEEKVEHENFTHGLGESQEEKHYLHKETPPLNELMRSKKMPQGRLNLNAECEMESAKVDGSLNGRVANLRAIFEPATQETQCVQRRFTRNGPNTALDAVCQGPASETLENPPKDDEDRAEQQSVGLQNGETGSLEEKDSVQDKNMTILIERETEHSKHNQTPTSGFEHIFFTLWEENDQKKTRAKKCLQTASEEHLVDLDYEKRQLLEEKKAQDEEYAELCRRIKRGPSKKQCAAVKWEIAKLKRHNGAMHKRIERIKSKLEQQAALKQQLHELEGVRNGLCEAKKAVQDELNQLCDEQDPETYKEMCLEKTNNIKKEIATLQEEVTQAKSTLEQIAVMKQQLHELEGVRNGLCEAKKAVQDELTQLCDEQDPETYKEMCLEKTNNIKKEIATLQEEVTQATSTLEQTAVMKLQFLELEDARNGLCEAKETVQDKLNWMSLEKANDIQKIVVLKSETGALQDEIELAKSRQEWQEGLKDCCTQFDAEKRGICCKNKVLQDELEEINSNIELQWSIEYVSELQIEIERLKMETEALQEEIEQGKAKLEQQPAMKQNCLELEDVRNGLRKKKEAVQDALTQVLDKLEPELCLEKANEIEKEITALKSHTGILQGDLESANSELQQQMSLKERCLELQAESRRVEDKNESIRREISQTLEKLSQEKSWKHKYEATRLLKHDVVSEMNRLLKHKGKLQKELDVQMGTSLKYKQKSQKMDKLRSNNIHQQQDVTEIRNHKSAWERYKESKAKSKQFKKQANQLQEEFDEPEFVKMEHVHAHSLDDLRKEERYLHNKISALDQETTGKKRLQVHQKSVQAGRAQMLQERLLQMI